MDTPLLSFVVIEFHSLDQLARCVTSIETACAAIDHQIVVSSNSEYSSEQQARLVKQHPNIDWVFNDGNLGFAGGMNAGLRRCKGRYLAIVNPDVLISQGDIRQTLQFMDDRPSVGVIGPRIRDREGRLQDSCRPFMSPLELFRRIRLRWRTGQDVLLDPRFDYDQVQPVDWVIGAFMIVRREALDNAGYLDDGYFLYVEDMDWCRRFWLTGYQVVYYPLLEVIYKGDRKSMGLLLKPAASGSSWRYAYYHFKSYMRFLYKHGIAPKQIRHGAPTSSYPD